MSHDLEKEELTTLTEICKQDGLQDRTKWDLEVLKNLQYLGLVTIYGDYGYVKRTKLGVSVAQKELKGDPNGLP